MEPVDSVADFAFSVFPKFYLKYVTALNILIIVYYRKSQICLGQALYTFVWKQ